MEHVPRVLSSSVPRTSGAFQFRTTYLGCFPVPYRVPRVLSGVPVAGSGTTSFPGHASVRVAWPGNEAVFGRDCRPYCLLYVISLMDGVLQQPFAWAVCD